MKKKLFLPVLLVAVLIVSACTSTTPALRDAVLENLFVESAEGTSVMSLSIDHSFHDELQEEAGEYMEYINLATQVLESGIVFDYKQSDKGEIYYKLSLVDPEPIKQLPFWTSEEDPSFEFVFKEDGNIYFNISSEDQWIVQAFLEDEELAELEEYEAFTEQITEIVQDQLSEFISQFDFDLSTIEAKENLTYETPAGEVDVKHLYMELTLDDLVSFASVLLDDLAKYDGWTEFIQQMDQLDVEMFESEPLTDEEIEEGVTEVKQLFSELQPFLTDVNQELIEELLGVEIDFLVKSDLYVTSEALIVGSDTTYEFGVKDPESEDYVQATLNVQSDVWNVNEEIEIDAPEKAISFDELMALGAAGELPEDSIFASLFASIPGRMGELTIDSDLLHIVDLSGAETIILDAPPYVTSGGSTMVPVHAINDIAGTEADWNHETKEATFTIGEQEVRVQADSDLAYVNGAEIEMPEAVVIENNRTFVPLRFVSENLGADVTWNQELQTVLIEL